MKMRPYQDAAIAGAFEAWKEAASALIVLPTGLGKTVVFSEVIRRFQPTRAIVIAHREELIFQAAEKIKKVTGLDGGIEMGGFRADGWFGAPPPYVVSTVQTQCSGGDGGGRMTKFLPGDFGLVVIDEAHHATAGTYRRVIDYYRQNPACKILGVTATPDRADEEALGQVFEAVAYDYQILDAIRQGWLVPIRQQMVTVESMDFSNVRTTAGDLNQGELAEVMEEEDNLQRVAVPTVEICGDRRAIVFAATVRQAERLCEIINRYRPDRAAWLCGKTDREKRRKMLADFKRGALQYVVNVGVLTEGFDDSGVEVIVMARPTKSRSLYAQMAGRGTRPHDSVAGLLGDLATDEERCAAIRSSAKPSCLIVDFCGNAGRHKLVTSADILGGNVSDEVVEAAARRARESGKPVDMSDALAEEQRLADERRKAEAAKRAALKSRAAFMLTDIDPFNEWDLTPAKERGWDRRRHFTDRQKMVLMQRIGVDADTIPYAQGKQLLDEYFRRLQGGYASLKQTRCLRKWGVRAPMRFAEAGRMITGRARAWS